MPKVAPRLSRLGRPGLDPPELSRAVELGVTGGVGHHVEDGLGRGDHDPLQETTSPVLVTARDSTA